MSRSGLRGSRVLITGASSGVGCATVDVFARAGADVALLARSEPGLQVAAAAAREHGVRAVVVAADVTNRVALGEAVNCAAAELGGLDAVVLNVAAVVFGSFTDTDAEDFDRAMEVTFLGTVNCVRSALPHLERSGGVLVHTGSIAGATALPTFSSYCASKHALRAFLDTLRIELRAQHSRVRIGVVHPGAIDTPLWDRCTGAGGRRPRKPPLAYSPHAVAEALACVTLRPRTVTLGVEAKVEQLVLTYGGPFARLILRGVYAFYSSSKRTTTSAGSLWQAAGNGIAEGSGLVSRPSLSAPLRRLGWGGLSARSKS